jgi:hypothetical protein
VDWIQVALGIGHFLIWYETSRFYFEKKKKEFFAQVSNSISQRTLQHADDHHHDIGLYIF